MKFLSALLCCVLGLAATGRAELPPQKTTLDCDHADMWSVGDATHGVCTGSVVLTGTNLRLTCDRLEFVALGVGDKTSTLPTLEKFQSMVATGHVVIVQGEREASCGRAEVLPHDDKVILTEQPILVDHGTGWTSSGEKITMLRGERRVVVEKSHVTGPALRDLGFDPAKKTSPGDGAAKPAPSP